MANSIGNTQNWTYRDISSSVQRLKNAFEGVYTSETHLLLESDNPIGQVSIEDKKVILTFRGSRDSFREIATCANVLKTSLRDIEISGSVHSGIFGSFEKIKKHTFSVVINALTEKGLVFQDTEVLLEGYSRGTGFSVLAAAYLAKEIAEWKHKIKVLNFSPIPILSTEAVSQYEDKTGRDNHLNFLAKEDFVVKWFKNSSFHIPGQLIEFSADRSFSYQERVASGRYTYLADNLFIKSTMKLVLSSQQWEAHMPMTYEEAAPTVFKEWQLAEKLV